MVKEDLKFINSKGNMEHNLTHLLSSELKSCSAYIDRIFETLLNVDRTQIEKELNRLGAQLKWDIGNLIEDEIFQDHFATKDTHPNTLKDLREYLQGTFTLIESLLILKMNKESILDISVKLINLVYEYAYDYHTICFENFDLDIQYPRVNLLSYEEIIFDEYTDEESGDSITEIINKFHLEKENIQNILKNQNVQISSLDKQRKKKYEDLLRSAHQKIFEKDPTAALELFQKANELISTAEALTLVGWAHSILGELEKAKSMCLKAIQKNPDYGPPYNDLGSYLLTEGNINESFKWFALAKKAKDYQNREYPFINSGRAFMAKREYQKALNEFEKALEIAPFHEELETTITKLKNSLAKSKKISPNTPDQPTI